MENIEVQEQVEVGMLVGRRVWDRACVTRGNAALGTVRSRAGVGDWSWKNVISSSSSTLRPSSFLLLLSSLVERYSWSRVYKHPVSTCRPDASFPRTPISSLRNSMQSVANAVQHVRFTHSRRPQRSEELTDNMMCCTDHG